MHQMPCGFASFPRRAGKNDDNTPVSIPGPANRIYIDLFLSPLLMRAVGSGFQHHRLGISHEGPAGAGHKAGFDGHGHTPHHASEVELQHDISGGGLSSWIFLSK